MPSSVATSSNGKALLISLDIDKNPIVLAATTYIYSCFSSRLVLSPFMVISVLE